MFIRKYRYDGQSFFQVFKQNISHNTNSILEKMVEDEQLLCYNLLTNEAKENIISPTKNIKSDTDEAEKCGKSEHIGKNHTKKKPRATTLFSTLPIIVLEMIFNRLDIVSIEHLYQADPYVEHTMDELISIQKLKEELYREEEYEFKKKQFALWRERLKIIHQMYRKKEIC